ncbi:DUF4296 domain-containing protein [Lacibacter luteus]|uniref:DUF4296 domain-containing protein n=1 Tax=Lacibacter luteus TaxID=2508719 RepID=A0A4Q1CNY3_9BACT|nr:DUF4296 domain-containing protein [Lacibacter luteus]RXK62813.1 DUF4296 domain-containing protein [Lacibacter luteus]
MRLKQVVILCVAVFLFACSGKGKVPSNVLGEQKFQAVLKDIVIADALSTEQSFKDTGVKIPDANAVYFLKVFEMHGVTKNQFMVSYNYYLSRPDLLKVVTDSVSAQLSRKSERLSADTSKPKPNGHNVSKAGAGAGNK